MIDGTMQRACISPPLDTLLPHVGDAPNVASALVEALAHHIELKTQTLKEQASAFESKWNMTFDEFAVKVKAGRVRKSPSPHDAKDDLALWEQTESLLRHYQSLKVQ